MKKILALLSALTLSTTTTLTVVACQGVANSNRNFKLSENSVEIETKTLGFVDIENYDILDEESLPSEFSYSDSDLIEVTVSTIKKQLIITPKSGEAGNVEVTVKSRIHEETLNVTVNKIKDVADFELEKKQINASTNTIQSIKIVNYDYLTEDKKPTEFKFSQENLVEAKMDSANKSIVLYFGSSATNQNLEMTVVSKDKNQKETVNITIKKEPIHLDQEDFVRNIIAGKIENGIIDTTYAIGDKGFTINEKSILDSFNKMNGINLSMSDVNLNCIFEGVNGKGAIWKIESSNGNTTGGAELLINTNIDPDKYFKNKNLGEIRLFNGAFQKLNDVLESKDSIGLGAIIFENVGARNPILEYTKGNFIKKLGEAGRDIMNNAKTTQTTFQISKMPDFNGVFIKDRSIEFTFRFVKEDRISFYEALPQENRKLNIDPDLFERNFEGQKKLRTAVYEKLSNVFTTKISLQHFLEFSKVKYDSQKSQNDQTKVTKIDILPGSDFLYGHDGAAFTTYINEALNKYEESKELDIKYTSGMGWLSFSAIKGDFHQGHDIFEAKKENNE